MKPAGPLIVALLTLAVVVSVPVAVAATNGTGLRPQMAATAVAPDPAPVETSLALGRPRAAADSAGTPQRGLRPRYTGRPPVRPADARRYSRLAAVAGSGGRASSSGRRAAPSGVGEFPAAPDGSRRRAGRLVGRGTTRFHGGSRLQSGTTPRRHEADPQNAAATNTEPTSRPAPGSLVRAERFLATGNPTTVLQAMNEILALRHEHDVVLQDDFDFQYAQVAFAAGRTQAAITSLNEYLVAAGRYGKLLDSAEVPLEQEAAERRPVEAERRRAEAARRRAARWPPGHVFRDCQTCPEIVVLLGSAVALGRYDVTVGEYRAFASTGGGPSQPLLQRLQRPRPR